MTVTDRHSGAVWATPALCDRPMAPNSDGSKWPDGRPREGVVMTAGKATSAFGTMIGKDFA